MVCLKILKMKCQCHVALHIFVHAANQKFVEILLKSESCMTLYLDSIREFVYIKYIRINTNTGAILVFIILSFINYRNSDFNCKKYEFQIKKIVKPKHCLINSKKSLIKRLSSILRFVGAYEFQISYYEIYIKIVETLYINMIY